MRPEGVVLRVGMVGRGDMLTDSSNVTASRGVEEVEEIAMMLSWSKAHALSAGIAGC